MKKIFATILSFGLALALNAQTITFDTNDYKAVRVYDSWVGSPFRTGDLTGNVQVIDNHLKQVVETMGEAPDATTKIVGLQRSRFGSNLFGIQVDLNETFRLTKANRYVHVMINRPVSDSRVMLITLGKRSERAGQSTDVEQTWSLSSTSIGNDGWYDAVFAIKGFSYDSADKDGIDIYSLVICPDVTDRSQMDEDFACYIDQIEISDNPTARFSIEDYPVNFNKEETTSRTDRLLNGVSLTGGAAGAQSMSGLSTLFYNDGTKQPTIFTTAPGETVQPKFDYTGTWMCGYVYVDWGNDGTFATTLNSNGKPATGSDVVSYNAYSQNDTWYKSDGTTVSNGNQITSGVPTFTVPTTTPAGFYRMRYKVDWNSIDAGGNAASDNLMTSNGGGIADVLLNVHGTECSVTAGQLNGDIYPASDVNTPLQDYKVAYGDSLRIKVVPAPGFSFSGIRVRYGYNLDGDSLIHENPQYFDVYYKYCQFTNDELTLPAYIFSGNQVEIEGYMVSEKLLTLVDETVASPNVKSVTMTGTRTRTYALSDNKHSLQDFTSMQSVPVQLGKTLATDPEGDLYIDLNRDGQFSLVTENVGNTMYAEIMPGVYKAVMVSGNFQFLFLINIHPEKVSVTVNSLNGRIISRQCYPSETRSDATGIPAKVLPFKFLGLLAQPLREGYTCGMATVRHGYDLDGDQYKNGVQQWSEYTKAIGDDQRLNVPLDSMNGNVIVTVDFTPGDDVRYVLSFSDEFNGTSIDSKKWVTSARANAAWNRFVSSDSRVAFLKDGCLVCRCIINDGSTSDDAAMLSGAKESRGKYAVKHGYIEARAKTNPHTGNFPAIWMMPEDKSDGWPTCGEIDIWETVNNENKAWQTVHSNWTYNLGNTSAPQSGNNVAYTMDGEWHTYGLLKEARKLTWYIDGTEVFTYEKSTDADTLANGQWPFDKEFYVILNQSVGMGTWASNPDMYYTYETLFDWVRIYEDTAPDGITDITDRQGAEDKNIYDLQGRRVATANEYGTLRPGIYIKGNKKILKSK